MGANTYRLMLDLAADGRTGYWCLMGKSKIVFSSTLKDPLEWQNTQLVTQDAVEAGRFPRPGPESSLGSSVVTEQDSRRQTE
jgi:hypothetical protein